MAIKKTKSCKKSPSRRSKSSFNDIELDMIVRTIEDLKEKTDSKLEEISDICLKRECNGR